MRATQSRRLQAIVLLTVASLGLAACGDDATADGGGEVVKIGFMGDLTGANQKLGINALNGAKLALSEYEATDPGVTIELVEYDSQGLPAQATSLAPRVIDDGIVGLVGPVFSGETADTGDSWEEAGLPFISPAATRVALADNGWTTFHRMLTDDGYQGPGAATIMGNAGFTKVAIIDDASEYGKGLANEVATKAAELNIEVAVREAVAAEGTTVPNYSSSVSAINNAGVDAIFYGGYYAQSGGFLKQLRDGGVTATFISGDGSLDPAFVAGAGTTQAEGAVITCPCSLVTSAAEGDLKEFYDNYTEASGMAPGTYSAEGYDTMNAFIKAVTDGNTTRETILPYITGLHFEGLSKTIEFQDNGNIVGGTIMVYQVKDGALTQIGTSEDAKIS